MHTSSAPASRPEPLTPAVFHVLLALAITERHGYGIMKQAEADSAGAVKMGPGTLYGTIKRLLEAGLIAEAGDRIDTTLDDQRRYYHLTERGRTALGLELNRLDQAVTHARQLGIHPLSRVQAH